MKSFQVLVGQHRGFTPKAAGAGSSNASSFPPHFIFPWFIYFFFSLLNSVLRPTALVGCGRRGMGCGDLSLAGLFLPPGLAPFPNLVFSSKALMRDAGGCNRLRGKGKLRHDQLILCSTAPNPGPKIPLKTHPLLARTLLSLNHNPGWSLPSCSRGVRGGIEG